MIWDGEVGMDRAWLLVHPWKSTCQLGSIPSDSGQQKFNLSCVCVFTHFWFVVAVSVLSNTECLVLRNFTSTWLLWRSLPWACTSWSSWLRPAPVEATGSVRSLAWSCSLRGPCLVLQRSLARACSLSGCSLVSTCSCGGLCLRP